MAMSDEALQGPTKGGREAPHLQARNQNSIDGIRYEDCPHCKGTGRRVAAPPYVPRKRGRPKGKTTRQHGTASTYSNGCRCELCRAAWREYRKNRRAERAS